MDTHALVRELSRLAIESRQMQGSPEKLARLLPKADALIEQTRQFGITDLIAVANMRKADIFMSLRDYPSAERPLLEAQKVLGEHRQTDLGVGILARLAECHGRQAHWGETASICEKGVKLVERYRYNVSVPYMQSGYLQSRIPLYAWGVRAAYEQHDYDRMLTVAELSKGRGSMRYIASGPEAKLPSSEMQELQSEFQKVCERIDAIGGNLTPARPEELDPRLTPLLAKRRTLWDQISIHRFSQITGEHLPIFDLRVIQERLADDEAIIYYYWLDPLTLLVTMIARDCVEPEIISIDEKQREGLDKAAKDLQEFKPGPHSWINRLSGNCSYLLPGLDRLSDKKRLIFSPHRVLHALPFHAFQWQNVLLLRRYALSYIPNLSTLLLEIPPVASNNVVILGVGEFVVDGFEQKPLKNAENEAATIAALYREKNSPVTLVSGTEVRDQLVKNLLREKGESGIACLHWVTHGANISSDTPLESFVSLYDSLLDGLEIANMRLNLDLVVLSACSSGQRSISGRRLTELPGDELFGLQIAFATAGCRQMLSTLWPVDDGIGSPAIMTAFHHYRLQGLPDDIALQRSTLDFLETAGPRSSQLYYWAPFFLTRFRL